MKLVINRFLPIEQKCEIDLSKKLLVFVGKNNSGKTYISQLIWGIFQFDRKLYINAYKTTPHQFLKPEGLKDNSNNAFKVTINELILNLLSKNYTNYLTSMVINKVFKKNMNEDIQIIFDIGAFRNLKIDVRIRAKELRIHLSKAINSDVLNLTTSNDTLNSVEKAAPINFKNINIFIESIIINSLIDYQPVFMPSTRMFLPSFYKYILTLEKDIKDSMFDNLDLLDDKTKNYFAASYTEPVEEIIKKLVFDLEDNGNSNEYVEKLINLIDGKIEVDRSESIGMADISFVPNSGDKLPMYLTSSMVNQLVTVYLYFKYWFNQGNKNFLLLDEPEMNLHPAKKLELLEILLSFAGSNKLLIATHSSSIAKAIINYLHLFDLKEKFKNDAKIEEFISSNDLKLDSNINLKSSDVGIYYFNGKTITSYFNNHDSNIHFGTFTEVEKLQEKQYDYIMEQLEIES